ncbi:MAG TPA: PfkB family carbohydrate kinase [Terriglobia bacterium]|nr:PfkB family carbohydrate kinase [Terriglobia bacterium]
MKIISVGEVLWDVIGQQEHLGGAPLNFAAHAARLGHEVRFVSAVGKDARGDRILERMAQMGLSTRYMRRVDEPATGIVTVTVDLSGQPQFVIHRPAAYDFAGLSDADLDRLFSWEPGWICFGTLFQATERGRATVRKLIEHNHSARLFYDVNLRKDCYDRSLVEDLMSVATVVKLNDSEALEIDRMFGRSPESLADFCRSYARRFGWEAVCATQGPSGCTLLVGAELIRAGGYTVEVADAVGAGDAFAAAFIHGLGESWPAAEIADFANRVGAVVASRPGAIPPWTLDEAKALERSGNAQG